MTIWDRFEIALILGSGVIGLVVIFAVFVY